MKRALAKAKAIGSCVALGLGVLLLMAPSAPARPFSVERDAGRVQTCFGAYLALAEAARGAASEPQKTWFSQAAAGAERIQPYVDAAAQADARFFGRATRADMATMKALAELPASSPARQQMLASLAGDAAECNRSLDDWAGGSPRAGATGPEDTNPDAVATSLLEATQTICVPYVVDAADIDALVRRPGISKRVDDVRGVPVTRYSLDAPGHPDVTPSPAKDFGVGPDGKRVATSASCWIRVFAAPDLVPQVVRLFRQRLTLTAYQTTPPHEVPMPGVLHGPHAPLYVTCIDGHRIALIEVSGPFKNPFTGEMHGEAEVDVVSDPFVTASEGCTPGPRP